MSLYLASSDLLLFCYFNPNLLIPFNPFPANLNLKERLITLSSTRQHFFNPPFSLYTFQLAYFHLIFSKEDKLAVQANSKPRAYSSCQQKNLYRPSTVLKM